MSQSFVLATDLGKETGEVGGTAPIGSPSDDAMVIERPLQEFLTLLV